MSNRSAKTRKRTPEEELRFKERMARRLARASRNRSRYPYWRRARFKETRLAWVCCDGWGLVPKRRLRMMFSADGTEYTPGKNHVQMTADETPHELRDGRFIPRPIESFVELYTDGSASDTRRAAGCGAVVRRGPKWTCFASPLPLCSSNEAEVMAVGLGLKQLTDLDEPICVVTDSDYVVQVLTDRIVPSTASQGCRKVRGLYDSYTRITVRKVKGHTGIRGNEKAHRLAHRAMKEGSVVDGQEMGSSPGNLKPAVDALE